MSELLKCYVVDTQFPDVSGIEHVHMLHVRDELVDVELTLSTAERALLAEADARLSTHAAAFMPELTRFIDLAAERRRRQIPPERWWWYLDVLAICSRAAGWRTQCCSRVMPDRLDDDGVGLEAVFEQEVAQQLGVGLEGGGAQKCTVAVVSRSIRKTKRHPPIPQTAAP